MQKPEAPGLTLELSGECLLLAQKPEAQGLTLGLWGSFLLLGRKMC
jgi:hypothetical protein